jgi:hypothetical protein
MLTEAIIQTSPPTSLKIEGADQDDLLILESISNLSRVQNSLYLGEFAREGGYYQGRRRNQLNPVFNFRLQPDYANDVMASDIREMLYDMFLEPSRDSDMVTVHLLSDRKPARLFTGYTETLESEIFAKELRAQVSLLTTDNYLRSVDETTVVEPTTNGWFNTDIEYLGSADTGFEFQIKVLTNNQTITVWLNNTEYMVLDGPWLAGQVITVNTQEGFRTISLAGVEDLGAMTGPSRWLTLRKGTNNLVTFGSTPGDGKTVILSYKYRDAWWGV